jgi:hypothetical protein
MMLSAHGAPGIPGDLEDHCRDRQADQRVRDRQAEGDEGSAGDDGEADVGVGTGVVAVGDQGWAVESAAGPGADLRGDPVAAEADQAGAGEGDQVSRRLRVDQPRDRLDPGDAGGGEDRRDDEQPGPALRPGRAQQEGGTERDRRCGVAEVMDQVGEQGNTAAATKIVSCAQAATASTASESPTASSPARERLMLSSTSPCECPWPSWWRP